MMYLSELRIFLGILCVAPIVESFFAPHSATRCQVVMGSHEDGVPRRRILSAPLEISAGAVLLSGTQSPSSALAAGNGPRSTKLTSGGPFDLASFGLQVYDDETARKLTLVALETGYRNFFASVLAGNQRGFAQAVKESGIPREELFICGSVVSNRASGFDAAYQATTRGWKANMGAFSAGNIDYLDMIMLDYPGPDCDSIRGQWKAFEEMKQAKLTRTLAVSNFSPAQLDCILSDAGATVPDVNQLPFSVAYHPDMQSTLAENAKRGVLVQAWAPLGGSLGGRFNKNVKDVCGSVGKKYGKSAQQVALRWIVQVGASYTMSTKRREHFMENMDVFDFELSSEDMARLGALA